MVIRIFFQTFLCFLSDCFIIMSYPISLYLTGFTYLNTHNDSPNYKSFLDFFSFFFFFFLFSCFLLKFFLYPFSFYIFSSFFYPSFFFFLFFSSFSFFSIFSFLFLSFSISLLFLFYFCLNFFFSRKPFGRPQERLPVAFLVTTIS